jgi:O-antigen ligase
MTPLRNWGTRTGAAVAACAFLTLLASLARVDQVPPLVPAGLLALAILAAARPEQALIALAAGVPVASWLGRQWNPSVAWPEALVVAFCAGYCARAAVAPPRKPDPLDPPVFLAAAVVVASLASQIAIDSWRFGGASTRAELVRVIASGYFLNAASSDPIDAAMRLIESLVLLRAAASIAQRTPGFAVRLTGWAVASAALAAALNLLRLWEGAARLEAPVPAFIRYFMTERLNVHYGDVNAAGSYFVLTLFAALALALAPKGRRWWLPAALIATSVWITSSRMAMMVAVLAMLLPAGAQAMRIRRGRLRTTIIAGAALGLAIVAGAAANWLPERGNQQSALAATQVRLELARTSLHMTAASPWFGVGIGRYYSRSGEFSSAELLRLFPPAIHENAHNNFLQILAELGIVGWAAVLWLLWTAARQIARLLAADARDPLRWLLATGLLAFVLSWLGGHPLLIDEPAFTFWLLLGAASGWGASLSSGPPARPSAWTAGLLVLLIAASAPVRVVHQRADFDLEHRGVGLSPWQPEVEGIRYRLAASPSSVFVPSDARVLVVPLRSVSTAPEVQVEIRLDGRPADVVNIASNRWHQLRIQMPQDREAPRFRRLEFRTTPSSEATPVLMIGKVEPR